MASEVPTPTQGHQRSSSQCPEVGDGLDDCGLCCVRLARLTLSHLHLPRKRGTGLLEAGVPLSSRVPQEAKPHSQC